MQKSALPMDFLRLLFQQHAVFHFVSSLPAYEQVQTSRSALYCGLGHH